MIRQALLRVLGPLTANVLAAVAFVLAAGTTWRWVTLAFILATVTVSVVRREGDGLGQFTVARAVAATAALTACVRLAPGAVDWMFNLAALLTIAYVVLEGILDGVSTTAIEARHLAMPGRPLQRLVNRTSAYLADSALIALVAVMTVAGLPSWVALAVALLAGLLFGGLVLTSIHYKVRHRSGLGAVKRALTGYGPDFLIYWDAPPPSLRQVQMWLPFLERVGRPFAIVVRNRQSLPALARLTGRPVILAPTIVAVDATVVPSLRSVFYVNNGRENAHMVRFAELTHVQLLHGDSEKVNSYNPVTVMFDQIFVAGQAGIDRYADNGVTIPAEKFRIVGRPQVENVAIVRTPISDLATRTVLYAPTWAGNFGDTNHCSLAVGNQLLAALLARPDVTVIMRHHQLTRQNARAAAHLAGLERLLAQDRAATGRAHLWGDAAAAGDFVDWANRADAMVADVSSVISDFLYSEKPFAVTDMQGGAEFTARVFTAAYVLRKDMANVDEVLGHLLGDDPLAATRRAVKAYYLGDFPDDTYADAFVDAARATLDRPTFGEAVAARTRSAIPEQRRPLSPAGA
ncbi:CDP-glycerol glycerophosphotransferase family protein [Luedemannella flava]|uniref:CDP-glycerol glycerophosphotransferase family protein n=1 Tax=Luedemannella flava TaxID=349316 RepID=A0ABP4YGA7_9ACTN